MDWAFLHFNDQSKKENEVNIGRILGFFKFENTGFPTPKNLEREDGSSLHDGSTCVVTRCCREYKNFDKEFVTEFELMEGTSN